MDALASSPCGAGYRIQRAARRHAGRAKPEQRPFRESRTQRRIALWAKIEHQEHGSVETVHPISCVVECIELLIP